ncbi:MAG: CcmD family protein [Sediminibacterium sp.]|nr:CcmD family protein [Sediminibacterium sp.]
MIISFATIVSNCFWEGQGKIGVVVAVLTIILLGIFAYLIYLDNKINKLKK